MSNDLWAVQQIQKIIDKISNLNQDPGNEKLLMEALEEIRLFSVGTTKKKSPERDRVSKLYELLKSHCLMIPALRQIAKIKEMEAK